MKKKVVFTIGHSTRKSKEFLELLQNNDVKLLVDVRTIAKSMHNPQFNESRLRFYLKKHSIKYVRMPLLGGLRHAKKDSVNLGWKNSSFRGFADYMQTNEFQNGIKALLALSKKRKIAIMCAEVVPWRCHRSLIGDALAVSGVTVYHILGKNSLIQHKITPFARVKDKNITYPNHN